MIRPPSRPHVEAIVILVMSIFVASSSAFAVVILNLLIDADTLYDWARHNQTIQQMSPAISWSIAHLHLIASLLLAWALAGIATGLGLLKAQRVARYGVWLWVSGIAIWSLWNAILMSGVAPITAPQIGQQQQLTMLASYAFLGLINSMALLILWRSERYFLQSM